MSENEQPDKGILSEGQSICLEYHFQEQDQADIMALIDTEKYPLKKCPHVTLLYVGKVSSKDFGILQFTDLVFKQNSNIKFRCSEIVCGKWSPVVMMKLEFADESNEQLFSAAYKSAWKSCVDAGIKPEMTNATPESHPGIHFTLGFANSIEETEQPCAFYRRRMAFIVGNVYEMSLYFVQGGQNICCEDKK